MPNLNFLRMIVDQDDVQDVDECQLPDACGSDHVCNNTVGSYRCECPLGFAADSGSQNPLDPVCVGEDSI